MAIPPAFLAANLASAPDAQTSSRPGPFQVCGSCAYFTANDVAPGRMLWRTDGTEDGTIPIMSISDNSHFDPGLGFFPLGDACLLFVSKNLGVFEATRTTISTQVITMNPVTRTEVARTALDGYGVVT